jgi:hypothetical protein
MEGLAMGASTSAILAKVYIQFLEYTEIANILKKYQIVDYHRYVDDILIIYNAQRTNIYDTLDEFNAINPNLKFTIEEQTNFTTNFLDLTITNCNNTLDCSILRKPTATDTIIHNASRHPSEHKRATIKYLNNRANTYNLSDENKKRENDVIEAILRNNGYYINNTQRDKRPKRPKTIHKHGSAK